VRISHRSYKNKLTWKKFFSDLGSVYIKTLDILIKELFVNDLGHDDLRNPWNQTITVPDGCGGLFS
jgi:hypothetical protein